MKLASIIAVACGVALAGAAGAGASSLITSASIKDGTIQKRDLSPSLRAAVSRAGTPGPVGATGAKGDTGATGAAGANAVPPTVTVTTVSSAPVTFAPFKVGLATVDCAVGSHVVGGGFQFSAGTNGIVLWSRPTDTGWSVSAYDNTTADAGLTAFAVCLTSN